MTLSRPRRPLRASTRRAFATGTIGIVLVATGILAGAGPAIGDQTTATTLGYTCQFPSGAQQVQAKVDATFPETGASGGPIEPTGVSVNVDIPQVALGDLTTLNAASVATKANFSVVVKHNGDKQTASWPNLVAPSAALPSTGDLSIDLSGLAHPVTETGAGDVVFAADAFGLLFTPVTSAGAATDPATVAVACTLNPDQTATLATVSIPDSATRSGTTKTSTGQPAKPRVTPHDDGDLPVDPQCDPNRPGGTGFAGDGSQVFAIIDSRTNLAKLNESTVSDGEITLTNVGLWFSDDFSVSVICYTGALNLPPSTATVLGFGFVPITTTLKYVQVNDVDGNPPMFVEAGTDASMNPDGTLKYPDGHPTGQAAGLLDIYVSSASINGTPLNVGPNCHTEKPISLVTNNIPDLDDTNSEIYPYGGVTGGYMQTLYEPSANPPVDNRVTISPFTDCGVDDNLDSLLSAPVSGPGNLVRICQGFAISAEDGPPQPPDEADNHCKAP
jgi:hypothetical protein